jgi:8-oxo-dGTP diphosphatase
MDKTINVSCDIFVLKDGQLLLGIRKGKYGAGDWGLPGGHLEWGEKLLDCAKRELQEETGLVAQEIELFTLSDEPRVDEHYIHFGFILSSFSGTPKVMEPDRCEKWEFFDLNELPVNLFNPHVQLIENLKDKTFFKS